MLFKRQEHIGRQIILFDNGKMFIKKQMTDIIFHYGLSD